MDDSRHYRLTGRVVVGDQEFQRGEPLDDLQAAIDDALAKAQKTIDHWRDRALRAKGDLDDAQMTGHYWRVVALRAEESYRAAADAGKAAEREERRRLAETGRNRHLTLQEQAYKEHVMSKHTQQNDTRPMQPMRTLDIEIYDTDDEWAQARYLVHGHDDVLWTDNIEHALAFLRDSAQPEHD